MKPELFKKLKKKAEKAYHNAYVPYSNFAVGAAVMTEDGEIFNGCNVENVSYGLTNCAERTAIFKAVAAGKRNLKTVLVLTAAEEPVSPCGACRQVISEFGENVEVIMTTFEGRTAKATIEELLPAAFNQGDMGDDV